MGRLWVAFFEDFYLKDFTKDNCPIHAVSFLAIQFQQNTYAVASSPKKADRVPNALLRQNFRDRTSKLGLLIGNTSFSKNPPNEDFDYAFIVVFTAGV